MNIKAKLEEIFKRKLPERREIIVLNSENDTLVSLYKEFSIGFLLEFFKAERFVMMDLKEQRVFEIKEMDPEEFFDMIEVVDTNVH